MQVMNTLQSFCQLKMDKLGHLATSITVLILITHCVRPVSTFVLPPEADETSKESTQIDTTSENLQPTESIATSLKPGIGESAWIRELQNLEQQSVEESRANESKDSEKSATGENVTPVRSSQSSSISKGEKPSRRGKKNDNPAGRSSMLRNSEVLTRETSKQMSPSTGYMSLRERIAAWLLANKKDNLWSGQPDDEESNPRHDVDDASLLHHVDKVQNYGNSRSSYGYDEDQPPVRGFGNSGSYLDDTLHAYHFNNDFMNNGLFPSFKDQEGYKNYMDMGKSQRPKVLGKERGGSTSLYDKLEAKRNSNNDAAKLHFAYYYDPESHHGSPEMKPPYPFFDKQYGMDDVFPFDGMGAKEKKPQHPKNTRKSQPKEHENNSFFTLENYVEDSAATRNEASSVKESKNVRAKAPQESKGKPTATKQPGTIKKSNNQENTAQNAKKTKAKVDNKDSRALNNSKKASLNNSTKAAIDLVSSTSNSSLNVSTNVNMSANSKVSAVRNQENHTELEELVKGEVLNRSDTVESKNETSKTVSSSIQTANIRTLQDTSTANKTLLTSASANMHIPESVIKNENNSYLHNETTESPSNISMAGESISYPNLTIQLDSKLREAKLETALSQSNETKLENIATNFTDSENAIEFKSNATKDQISTSVFNQTTQIYQPTTPTYSEPNNLTTTEPNLISQKNGTGDMSFNHKEPNSVAASKNVTITDVLEITFNSTSGNISSKTDRQVNESTSYSHRNASSFKTSHNQEEKLGTLNETWNLQVVNATDLRASVLASTGTNESMVDELPTVFSTAREQKNSDVKPLSTTETPMTTKPNATLGDKPNNSTTSIVSVSSKNVERISRGEDMDYEKVFVSSSSRKEVLVSKQNVTERGDLSSGNSSHIASLLEVAGGDTKIEELAPKGTEREEKSELTEQVKAHIDQRQNKTEPEILRNSEEVMSRLEILNITADTVHKVNESSVTPTVSVNQTTTENSLLVDRPNFESNGNSTLNTKTAFNGSALINNLAARTAEQKSIEPFQAVQPNNIVNSTQSNETSANITLNIVATVENSTISFVNTTKDVHISTNTSSLEIAHKNVSSSNGDTISNLVPSNTLNMNEPAASAQHKNLTSKLSLDINVSRSLPSLDKDLLINATEQRNDREITEGLNQVNSSLLSLNKTNTLSRILSGDRLESLNLDINSTAESKLLTPIENQIASNISNTSADNSLSTTTAGNIMLLPEALPNSEVLVGKQLDNHKPQLENIGNARQSFSSSMNDSVPTYSNQTEQDGRQKLTVDNVKASNSTLDSSVSLNSTEANSKPLNNEGKADYFRAAHSCIESSTGNEGIISAAASADVKDASPSTNSTSDLLGRSENKSRINNFRNEDNETSVISFGGVASQDMNDVNSTIASVQRRSADNDPKVFTVGSDNKPSAVNNTRNSSAEVESLSNPEKLQQLVASSEEDIPPISAYMAQDFSLRKTPETKNTKDNSNKPKESSTQGSSDKAKVDSKPGAAANASASPLSNITSRAAEAQCSGPACDLAPMSAVSRSQAAVSAVLTTHFGPAKDIMIPFDLELLDLADNYDNTTGMFICTVPGTYVISLYLMSHPGAKVNARIFVNNRPIAALWADDSKNAGFYPSSSTQTIAQLGFGDQVYVMLVDGGYGESWVHANYNVFTIFLLYEQVF